MKKNSPRVLEKHPTSPRLDVRDTIGLCILGSTGSIGTQALQIVDSLPDRFEVEFLTARSNADLLVAQALKYRPRAVAIADHQASGSVVSALSGSDVKVLTGPEAATELAARPSESTVIAAMVGFAGLRPVLAALERGATVALANKETLVAAGAIVTDTVRRKGGRLLPVDSEHSAIFQCLVGEAPDAVRRLILTASGGPFRDRAVDTFASITVDEALAHPNWNMGAKITIDSATMMNKGLEVIEAHWLFDMRADQIEVLIHPQSIVHSMVEFVDGSTKAQLGEPDMRVPIQYALTYPDRAPSPDRRVDWMAVSRLDFQAPDLDRFPCLGLAFEALRRGGSSPAVLNAANEAAVARFLAGDIRYLDIVSAIERALEVVPEIEKPDLQMLVQVDAEARKAVLEHKLKTHH